MKSSKIKISKKFVLFFVLGKDGCVASNRGQGFRGLGWLKVWRNGQEDFLINCSGFWFFIFF